ncbi:ATP-binding protein [Deinococcus marmoris]|uniref:Large transcriptional regulator n=1 Tax=Deinococcus marmoris TaxID=249408 RepID=A0A1U7P379_9DEIO|nr:AAA family ATPase [Deinococcus marmoris]OLV19635.1 large transcriptional regulator [Deinococcus marmoris]
MLELTLLGTPRVAVDGQAVKLATHKSLLLLARVGLEGRATRAELAALLWPASPLPTARQNLRVELYRLGRTAAGPYLLLEGGAVEQAGQWRTDALDPAHDLNLAELLPGEVADDALGDWTQAVRETRRAAQRSRLLGTLRRQEAGGDLGGAATAAQAIAALDPLDEAAQAQWLRLLAQGNEPEAAHAAYHAYASRLRRELDAEPGPDVRRWGESAGPTPAQTAARTLRAPMIGREALWRDLRSSALPTLLLGEPGVGKSRLAGEFSAQHRPRLIVRGLAEARWWLLGAVSAALRSLWERDRLTPLGPGDAALLSRLIPELSTEPVPPGASLPASSITGASPEQRQALFAALSRALLPGLRRGMLVLEDLHDFDDLSLEAAGYVLAEVSRLPPDQRPHVLLTARPPELAAHPAASALVSSLEGRGELRRLTVGRLQETDVLVLVRTLGRTAGGTRFAARLHAATAGNPLFLLETLRHLRERGDLTDDAGGQWQTRHDEQTEFYAELSLPGTVLSAVQARVRALGDGARRVLEALAVLSGPAPLDTLEALTGLDAWALTAAIGAARDASLLVPRAGGYTLAHDLYRLGTLAGLTPERSQLLHRQAAVTLAAAAAPARQVAEHWLGAGQPQQAGEWLLRAAGEAEAIAAHGEGLGFLDEALALEISPHTQARVHALAFQMHLGLGNAVPAQPHLDALRRLADQLRDGALEREAEVLLAALRLQESEFQQVIEITDRLLGDPLPGPLAAQMHLSRGHALIRVARFEEAETHLQEVLRSGTVQRTRWSFRVHFTLAQLYFPQGRFAEAEHHAGKAEKVARVLGDPQTIAQGLLIRGVAAIAHSKPAEAVPLLQEAQQIARLHGPYNVADMITLNLGTALMNSGHRQEAREAFKIAADSEYLQPEIREAAAWNLGSVSRMTGELGEALTSCEQALASAQKRGMLNAVLRRRAMLADFRLHCGHPVQADELANLRAEVTRLGLGELDHFLQVVALRRALLCGTVAEVEAQACALEAISGPADEQEARTLLLAEACLRASDPTGAARWVSQAPPGAWRCRLNLRLLREQLLESGTDALAEARCWLAALETAALEGAFLAAELARGGQAEDVQEAHRRTELLLGSLEGRPERLGLARLLA